MLNCNRISLVVDVAVFLIFVMMCTGGLIEEGARQEKELNELKDIEASTGALTMKMEEWERKHNRVAKLWLFQTVNHLSLFDACSSLVKSSVWAAPEHHEKVKNRLVKLNEKLFGAIFNMGPHEMFLKDDGEGDLLFNASEQTTASIAEMKKHSEAGDDGQVGWRIDNLFGLLIIKVIQAHGLSTEYEEDGESEVLTDNYVLLRIADTEREDCLRTATVKGGQSASWDNEFVVETPRDQETFKLELFGSDETAPVGVVDFLVQSAPGRWVSKTDNLKNAESGKAGKLEYAYFFANGLKQLAEIDQKRTNRMQSIMGFLGGTRSMRAGSTLNPVLKGRLSQLVQS